MLSTDLDVAARLSRVSQARYEWPRSWRPYAALLSGFCGMANCWYRFPIFHDIVSAENGSGDDADDHAVGVSS